MKNTKEKPTLELTDQDIYLFNEGTHYRLYDKLGSKVATVDGVAGTNFSVWAPNAKKVCVMGDFNSWDKFSHPLSPRGQSGIWEGFIPKIKKGDVYKYFIESNHNNHRAEKADPFAFYSEVPPKTASVVWDLEYQWGDHSWMKKRAKNNAAKGPTSIYEIHLGSWKRVPEKENRSLTYRELAPLLVNYVKEMGFTHVEFMPIMEHPFYGSWGYQVTGYFAATSRYGTPQDLMYLIDQLHQNDIGVILDWVPSHFPSDAHGLGFFDGTYLYEHADPRQGFHPDWKSLIYNYGRNEVKSFLISSALFWMNVYHVDGLRVDGVASMLYLDYSRKDGEWTPNKFGGKENIDAIQFLRQFNVEAYKSQPDIQTSAEESTSWPMVSRPTYIGGLGFGYKWDMGWMHDTLRYFSRESIHRRHHHHELSFRMLYAFTENFILSLSHDEVVHGKGSLLGKMPGDDWQKFANLRLLYGYMFASPGKKLFFMGGEFGQRNEWNHDSSLDWHLLENPQHRGTQKLVSDLNQCYRKESSLHELDSDPAGFQWIDCSDALQSIICFLRKDSHQNTVLTVFNFTPVPRHQYMVGVPHKGFWKELMNTDAEKYGGSGLGNYGGVESMDTPFHGQPHSLNLTLPPLSALYLKCDLHAKNNNTKNNNSAVQR